MTKTPQTEAENTPKLHIFGSHFRDWREKRGYSLKEAAGNTMSVASLSRFETDKQSISIEKLAELLMNIGVDIAVFMSDYSGQRIEKYAGLILNSRFDEISTYYQAYPKWLKFVEYLAQTEKSDKLISSIPPTPLKTDDFDQLFSKKELNIVEMEVIRSSLFNTQFPLSYVPQLIQLLKNTWNKSTSTENGINFSQIFNCFAISTFSLQFLSRQGYHQEVFTLVDHILKRINQLPAPHSELFIVEMLSIQMYEVYSLIRSGDKTNSFKKRQDISKALDALIAADFGSREITIDLFGMKSQFRDSCNHLLSGQQK